MAAPNVQLAINGDKIQVFWDLCLDGTYSRWRLYYDNEPSYVDWNIALDNIPNEADSYYSDRHVTVNIIRPYGSMSPVYLWIAGITPVGVVDIANKSLQRYVPAQNETEPMVSQKIHGYDPDTNIWRPVKVEKDTDPSIAGVLDVTP
jgi:hypothetical protein